MSVWNKILGDDGTAVQNEAGVWIIFRHGTCRTYLLLCENCEKRDAEIKRLLVALENAREIVLFWSAYASDYFRDKHNLEADIDEIDAALGKKL